MNSMLVKKNPGRQYCRCDTAKGTVLCRGEHLDGRKAAKAAIAEAHADGGRICAFFCESVLSCGGQVSTVCNE